MEDLRRLNLISRYILKNLGLPKKSDFYGNGAFVVPYIKNNNRGSFIINNYIKRITKIIFCDYRYVICIVTIIIYVYYQMDNALADESVITVIKEVVIGEVNVTDTIKEVAVGEVNVTDTIKEVAVGEVNAVDTIKEVVVKEKSMFSDIDIKHWALVITFSVCTGITLYYYSGWFIPFTYDLVSNVIQVCTAKPIRVETIIVPEFTTNIVVPEVYGNQILHNYVEVLHEAEVVNVVHYDNLNQFINDRNL